MNTKRMLLISATILGVAMPALADTSGMKIALSNN